jgi:hypothetical protein
MYLYVQLHSFYALQWLLCIWHQHVYITQHSSEAEAVKYKYIPSTYKYKYSMPVYTTSTYSVQLCPGLCPGYKYIPSTYLYNYSTYSVHTSMYWVRTKYILSTGLRLLHSQTVTLQWHCSPVTWATSEYKLCAYLVWQSAAMVRTQVSYETTL